MQLGGRTHTYGHTCVMQTTIVVDTSVTLKLHPSTVSFPVVDFDHSRPDLVRTNHPFSTPVSICRRRRLGPVKRCPAWIIIIITTRIRNMVLLLLNAIFVFLFSPEKNTIQPAYTSLSHHRAPIGITIITSKTKNSDISTLEQQVL